jgi:uncharacterized membrane protein
MTLMILYVGGGILLSILSVPLILGRVPPNALYGFRVPSTLSDPSLWYQVNRYAGRRLLVVGVLAVVGAVGFSWIPGIGVDAYALDCLAVVGSGLLVGLAKSFHYLRVSKS